MALKACENRNVISVITLLIMVPMLAAGMQTGLGCLFCACEQHNPVVAEPSEPTAPQACCSSASHPAATEPVPDEGHQIHASSCDCYHEVALEAVNGVLVENAGKTCSLHVAVHNADRIWPSDQKFSGAVQLNSGPDPGNAGIFLVNCKMQC